MNRRSFFKVVTGFVTGVVGTSVEGKKRSGTRYCGESSTGIDPNSEWAKQEPLTLAKLQKIKEKLEAVRREEIMAFLEQDYLGNYPAYITRPDGIEFIHYRDFFKTKV